MKKTIVCSLVAVFALVFSIQSNAYTEEFVMEMGGNPDIVRPGEKNRFLARGCKVVEGFTCVIKGGHPELPPITL